MVYPEWPLVSTDSHGNGPPREVYLERLPKHLREDLASKMPRRVGEGEELREIDPVTGRRRRPLLTEDLNKVDAGDSPRERIPFLAVDGVGAEVIYTGGIQTRDATLEAAVALCRIHNDWIYETYRDHFDRFAPAATIPIAQDIGEGIKEMERAVKLGLRPVALPGFIEHRPWNRPDYDRFWAVANDLGVPLAIHSGRPNFKPFSNPGGAVANYMYNAYGAMEPLSLIVCSGVLERHPKVRITFVENDVGWLAWAMEFMDRATIKHQQWVYPKLPLMPSEYVKRQVKATFMEDPVGVKNRHITGLETIMWGSDFPHSEGSFPHSRDVIAETFEGCTAEEVRKITHDTGAKLYGFRAETFVEIKK